MSKASIFFLFCLVVFLQAPTASCSIIDIINQLVVANLGKLNEALHQNIPESLGACSENGPPLPCTCMPGCVDLYNIHKSWEYKAQARWITGLRSGNITSIVFSDAGAVISVAVKGLFQQLPLSLYIAECLTFDQCVKLWDNTDGCCGNNKNFGADIVVDCKNAYPYLYNIRLAGLTLDHFEITEKIIGISVDLKDITDTVEAAVSSVLTDYLTKEIFIPYNGTKVSLLDFANNEILAYTKGFFACPTSPLKYKF